MAWQRRGQQWSKPSPLLTARSQLPENHIAAAAVTPATTGIGSSSLLRNVLQVKKSSYLVSFYLCRPTTDLPQLVSNSRCVLTGADGYNLFSERIFECDPFFFASNSSVLSGELPPAMGKTALFYHSGGSSGYESMLRDSSENTGSTSSAQDSLSEHSSATTSSRRSSKSGKKSRSNTGHIQTWLSYFALMTFSHNWIDIWGAG